MSEQDPQPTPDETASVPAATTRPARRPKKTGRWYALGVIVCTLVAAACGQALYTHTTSRPLVPGLADAPAEVTCVTAERATYQPVTRYVGTIEPWLEASIGPQLTSAYVTDVRVRPGALVARGEVVATLDCRESRASAQIVRDEAQAQGAQERALARQSERTTALLEGGFVAANDRVQHEQEARLETLAQLRHADRLRTIGELAASVAHDLGTPMGTVSARAQMIANADVDPTRARELAASIVEEIERMSKSIRTLLDHGRREGPQLAVTDARSLAEDVLALLAPLAASRRVRLVLVDGPDTSAKLDAAQVRHVLINLVTNAIDASPATQTVELRVSATNDRLLLEVDDRGAGIPADRMDRVFDPFFTTKPKGEGTGLGLSIARGIVQEHGGTLVVSARDGGGSTFVVDLPVDPRDESLGVH